MPSNGTQADTVTERVGVVVMELANGEEMTTREVSELANMSTVGAWLLMSRLCRVLPLTFDRGKWKILAGRSWPAATLVVAVSFCREPEAITLQIERAHEDVITLRHERKTGLIASYLLMGDLHWDSQHCDRRMLQRHLEQAVERDAGILVGGDLFDAMQGKEDRRGGKGDIRPELKGDNYFDRLIDQAAEWFAPYAKNIVVLADGNHETAILRHQETDLLARLSKELSVQHMGYSGYINFFFERNSTGGTSGRRQSFDLYYHHGSGGGGPVTKGMIGNSRRSMAADADIFWSQHIHEFTLAEYAKITLKRVGKRREPVIRRETHVTGGGYKQEYSMSGGYHIERGRPPKTNGAWWRNWIDRAEQIDYLFERTM